MALASVLATGCSDSTNSTRADREAAELWSLRTAYLGDNSQVAALVSHVLPPAAFGYSLSLHTSSRPFGLTVRINRSEKPVKDTDFREQATLLLALIDNVDVVTISSAGGRYSLTVAEASKDLKLDVKSLGRSQTALSAYVHGY